jgi:hypothetical protein
VIELTVTLPSVRVDTTVPSSATSDTVAVGNVCPLENAPCGA